MSLSLAELFYFDTNGGIVVAIEVNEQSAITVATGKVGDPENFILVVLSADPAEGTIGGGHVPTLSLAFEVQLIVLNNAV